MRYSHRQFHRYLLWYSLLFCLVMGSILLPFVMQHRTLIWTEDAKAQYYLQLRYMGQILREFVKNLLHGRLSFRMYDFIIGMGDDINTLVKFHPLDFLSLLVPADFTKYLYSFLTLLRIYLAGLSFSAFCFYWKKPAVHVLTGSLVYISCGYMVRLVFFHSHFGSPVIMFPLLLIGAEEVLRGRRKLLFSFFVFLSFMSNYYFTLMSAVGVFVYVVLRFIAMAKEDGKRSPLSLTGRFFAVLLSFAFYSILGAAMSALTLFPILMRVSASPRLMSGTETGNMLFYPLYRYGAFLLAMISPDLELGSITKLGYAVTALPCIVLLVIQKKKSKGQTTLTAAIILETALLMLPAFGYLMSGMSNINNRWTFMYSFTVSMICVSAMPLLCQRQPVQKKALAVVLGILCVLACIGTYAASKNALMKEYRLSMWAGLGEYILFFLIYGVLLKKQWTQATVSRALLTVTALCCITGGIVIFAPGLRNSVTDFMKSKEVSAYFERAPMNLLKDIDDDGSFYRIDTDLASGARQNISLYYGYQGIACYNSVLNADTVNYLLDQENPGLNGVIRIASLDGRTVSENLACVRYLLTRSKRHGAIPAGFERDDRLSGEKYSVYRNTAPLAFGFVTDRCISTEDYLSLSTLDKQQVMFTAVVADSGYTKGMEQIRDNSLKNEIQITEIPLPEKDSTKIKSVEEGYQVLKKNADLKLSVQKRAGYECYLHLTGLSYQGRGIGEGQAELRFKMKDGTTKTLNLRAEGETYYLPREDYLICLGCSDEDEKQKLRIRFSQPGMYALEGIELCYVPVGPMMKQIEELNRNALKDVKIGLNTISGETALERTGCMVFSIPYSSGWKAWVDGEKRELFRADIGYTGLVLSPGAHKIVLRYMSPGLLPGLICFSLGWGIFLILLIFSRRKKHMDQEKTYESGIRHMNKE